MRLAGFATEHPEERFAARVPLQWAQLMGASPLPGQCNEVGYGVRDIADVGKPIVRYAATVEVAQDAPLPDGAIAIEVPAASYAVFAGFDHVADLRAMWGRIIREWLPTAPCQIAWTPAFERYGEGFDPLMGRGDMSLWVPVLGTTG